MKRAALAIASTIAALVMLLSFKTHNVAATATPPAAVSSPTAGAGSGTTSTGVSRGRSGTFTGAASYTRYGPVQVRVTVTKGAVSAVEATQYPMSNPRDAQINSYAIPALNSEATAAKSAQIDMISGATFTSEGYLQSLQSALNKAGL